MENKRFLREVANRHNNGIYIYTLGKLKGYQLGKENELVCVETVTDRA